ncbi:MAG: hypothetical protein ABEJ99_01305 [Candidatus Nanohaloarchaea archaeon]
MNRNHFIAVFAVAGVVLGLVLSHSMTGKTYCQKLEGTIKQNKNFTGSVACFEPGSIDVNLSDQVKNNADLRCVCRTITNGQVHILPITFSKGSP